nr:MAG TPA: hypothetical protein [Caudoviricetes sp.]
MFQWPTSFRPALHRVVRGLLVVPCRTAGPHCRMAPINP